MAHEAGGSKLGVDDDFVRRAVSVVRGTREHPDVRIGSSVRGAIDLVLIASELAELRGAEPTPTGVDDTTALDAACMALSGRIRVHESCHRTPEEIIAELWDLYSTTVDYGEGGGRGRPGKRLTLPDPAGRNDDRDKTLDDEAAQEQLREESRRTTSRRELSANEDFDQLSPELGVLDEQAVEESLAERPDETLSLLADMAGATDEKLRALARRLAARLVIGIARADASRRRGIGKMRSLPMDETGGDLDLDASIESLQLSSATGVAPRPDELSVRTWARPETALCLVVDRSGSMTGDRLAAAAVAAAAVAERAPDDFSVLAFSDKVLVLKGQDQRRSVDEIVDDVFRLRGHGPTDLALALRVAADQLATSTRPAPTGHPAVGLPAHRRHRARARGRPRSTSCT